MKIYIAGKITGLPLAEAAEKFAGAAAAIERAGHTPLNPVALVDQAPGRRYEEYLLDALRVMLLEAEAVFFLDNFLGSRGALIEHFIADQLEIPKYFKIERLPIGSDWPEQVEVTE